MSARNIIRQSDVTLLCTTDDPVDSLEWHEAIKADESFEVQVLPAWRPDKAVNIEKPTFAEYLAKLSEVSGVAIEGLEDLKKALCARLRFFADHGCLVSDHGIEYVYYQPADDETVDAILRRRLSGG